MRNHENQLKLLYDDICDIQNRLKYIVIGAFGRFCSNYKRWYRVSKNFNVMYNAGSFQEYDYNAEFEECEWRQ